jgi:hypothetical protein
MKHTVSRISCWTKKAALFLNVQRSVEHSKSTIISAAFSILYSILLRNTRIPHCNLNLQIKGFPSASLPKSSSITMTRSRTYLPPLSPKRNSAFTYFPRLPKELRLMIWGLAFEPRIVGLNQYSLSQCTHQLRQVSSNEAVPGRCNAWGPGRVHELVCNHSNNPAFERLDEHIHELRELDVSLLETWPPLGWHSPTPVPPLLHVCQESRSVAAKSCTPSFPNLGSKAQTYFNFESDTLYFTRLGMMDQVFFYHFGDSLRLLCSEERVKIQNLALDISLFDRFMHESHLTARILWEVISIFGNLKKVTLVVQEYTPRFSTISSGDRSVSQIFLDPVDIDRKRYLFEHPEYHLSHGNRGVPSKRVFSRIEEQYLAKARNDKVAKGEPAVPLPVLEHKILTSSTVKADYGSVATGT